MGVSTRSSGIRLADVVAIRVNVERRQRDVLFIDLTKCVACAELNCGISEIDFAAVWTELAKLCAYVKFVPFLRTK